MSQGMEGERTVYREDCEKIERGVKEKLGGVHKRENKVLQRDQLCHVHPEDMQSLAVHCLGQCNSRQYNF